MPEPDPIQTILNRPTAERLREYKYRFAQSTVFGLPVIALHYFGPSLGGPEAGRWIGMLQMLLAGWVMYVGVIGMVVEGILRRKITADALVGCAAVLAYSVCAVAVIRLFITGRTSAIQDSFHAAVPIAIGWSAIQWFRCARMQAV